MIKSKGMELMELINQLGQIETIDTEITFAIFRSSTQKKMEEKEVVVEETQEVLAVVETEEDVQEDALNELSNNKGEEVEENE